MDNAVKYTFHGDTVLIEGRAYELFYRIDVTDHGKGIPEEDIPKIFQRFYRSPKNREEEGVGLGLYLAREIIRVQGGYMKVASGEKTVFSIFLPKREEAYLTAIVCKAKAE
ncbi:sensor histidine kinase [Candidatus Merdisoma sp. JLR.KK011]|uniref:sensor histidine kinase n=1 Tax=Candidatus Merdisoma sp. JLR.KK011 TaxID=3114299 RepID=UPI002FEFF383